MRYKKELDTARITRYIKNLQKDIRSLKFEEELDGDKRYVKLGIGNFFLKKEVTGEDNYEVSVKRLFEDFMTNTSYYYIRNFWEL